MLREIVRIAGGMELLIGLYPDNRHLKGWQTEPKP